MRNEKIGLNKRGQLGEYIEMVPNLILTCLVVGGVLGISSTFYYYEISVRDAEARLLGRGVVDCLASDGVLNLDEIGQSEMNQILDYCGFARSERFYVGVEILDSSGNELASLKEGDAGLLWVRDLFEKTVYDSSGNPRFDNKGLEKIANYNPGYFSFEHDMKVVDSSSLIDGKLKVEVLVNYE